MSAPSSLISLGIGSGGTIAEFIFVGLSPSASVTGTIDVTAFAARCAILADLGAGRTTLARMRRLTSTREEIPIPADQPEQVQAAVRAAQYRLDHPGTTARIPQPGRAEPTVQQSIRAIRKKLERLS